MAVIALDYDNTYSLDPQMWNEIIDTMQRAGHRVICVTMRYGKESRFASECKPVYEALANRVDDIYCTGRKAKRTFLYERGINVNVWIDDSPHFVLYDAVDVKEDENEL